MLLYIYEYTGILKNKINSYDPNKCCAFTRRRIVAAFTQQT
jgi:hypothetical protein